MKIALALLVTLAAAATSNPVHANKDLMWWPTENGNVIPIFLRGMGPESDAELTDAERNTHFYLFTRSNPTSRQELQNGCINCLINSNFDRNAPVKVLIHGFTSSPLNLHSLRDAYLSNDYPESVNVILVDWTVPASAPWYERAAGNTRIVGAMTGELINFLVREGYTTFDKVHATGHSLGAHTAAFASNAAHNGKFGRITGMDPALPLFGEYANSDADRIDPEDADFVDVIHTAGGTLWNGGLAFIEPRGQADYYPNNGVPSQPGCLLIDAFGVCSHMRVVELMAESISNPSAFDSVLCEDYDKFKKGQCDGNERTSMGEGTPITARGTYYLQTNNRHPFSKN